MGTADDDVVLEEGVNADRTRRSDTALADAADIRALTAAAFAIHVRSPDRFAGPLRILWNGWVEDWSDFYAAHRVACAVGQALSASARMELADHHRVLEAFRGALDLAELADGYAEERRGRWKEGWTLMGAWLRFVHQHGRSLLRIRASRRQLSFPFPGLDQVDVPAGTTRH